MTTHDRDKIIAAAIGCIEGPYDSSRAITITGNEIERFYAIAFEAGAASRDAEVARLKTVPMRYRRMAFNAQLQNEIEELVAAQEESWK